jgi:hypothetical protein
VIVISMMITATASSLPLLLREAQLYVSEVNPLSIQMGAL